MKKLTVRETFGLEEKEAREEKIKENLRRAIGKRNHSQNVGFSGITR